MKGFEAVKKRVEKELSAKNKNKKIEYSKADINMPTRIILKHSVFVHFIKLSDSSLWPAKTKWDVHPLMSSRTHISRVQYYMSH